MVEYTFAMIKPDAVKAGHADEIIQMIKDNGFEIVQQRKEQLSCQQAEKFYDIHSHQPWFSELIDFITSGPVVLLALKKENAIQAWRDLMGATDPAKAQKGTIREKFGTNIGENATHGSDAPETAAREIDLMFPNI
jgi:nucleoside-diphosphate kinase